MLTGGSAESAVNGILITNGKYVVLSGQVGVKQPAIPLQGCPAGSITGSPTSMKAGTIYYVQYTIVGECIAVRCALRHHVGDL